MDDDMDLAPDPLIFGWYLEEVSVDPRLSIPERNRRSTLPVQMWGPKLQPEDVCTLRGADPRINVKVSVDIESGNCSLHTYAIVDCSLSVTEFVRNVPHPDLLNYKNGQKQTPLHVAVARGSVYAIRALLAAGCQTNTFDEQGIAPLHFACIEGNLESAKALVLPMSANEFAFARRAFCNHGGPSKYSTQIPADLEIISMNGLRSVHYLARNGFVDIFKFLTMMGVNINAKTLNKGYTPLHLAVRFRKKEVFKFLITDCPGVDLEARTHEGLTPYQYARVRRNLGYAEALRKRGAKVLPVPSKRPIVLDCGCNETCEDSGVSSCDSDTHLDDDEGDAENAEEGEVFSILDGDVTD